MRLFFLTSVLLFIPAAFHMAASPLGNTTLELPSALSSDSYEIERAITLSGKNPVALTTPSGIANELYVADKRGTVVAISDWAAGTVESEDFLNISDVVDDGGERGLLGLAFHPDYQTNRQFFVFYCHSVGGTPRNRISRFLRSDSDPYKADSTSEVILIDQHDQATNHNGGDMHFGPDGYLYISLGDEGGGSDSYNNGQFVDKDFFAGIIRIDVDKLSGNVEPTEHPAIPRDGSDKAYYSVPVDNPLISIWQNDGSNPESDLRTEFYAVGLRNPWRMSFDPATGDLWVADVGQGKQEEVDIVTKGGNYGWPNREGTLTGPKSPAIPAGFETLSDPVHVYGRDLGTSTTGGVVYRGTNIPELEGTYIWSDYNSGRVWSLAPDSIGGTPNVQEITNQRSIAGFGRDPNNGDVLAAQLSGWIGRLVKTTSNTPDFPESLSATGAFENLADLTPNPGILSYEPNVAFWSDYATKQRWVSFPDGASIANSADEPWSFPTGSVWIKHFDLEMERGNPDTKKRVETRFIVKTETSAYGLSYRWNDDGTDATLVDEDGENIDYQILVDGQPTDQTWRIPSRQECMQCHTAAEGYALSFNTRQLNRNQTIDGSAQNLLEYLSDLGVLENAVNDASILPAYVDIKDEAADLEERARTYLAVNCVFCHQPGGSAPLTWDARPHISLEATMLIDVPAANDGGDSNRRLIKSGDPNLSVLINRILASEGFTRMPPIGSNETDHYGVTLLTDWITSLGTLTAFQQWQFENFGSVTDPIAQAEFDADHDGNTNLMEFLTKTLPTDPTSKWLPSIERDGDSIQIIFSMHPENSYTVEYSTDLIQWIPWNVTGNPPANNQSQAEINGVLPVDPDSSYLRVKVSN